MGSFSHVGVFLLQFITRRLLSTDIFDRMYLTGNSVVPEDAKRDPGNIGKAAGRDSRNDKNSIIRMARVAGIK